MGNNYHALVYLVGAQRKESRKFSRNNLLSNAGKNDVCFIENQALPPYEKNIEALIVYRWNRIYPADVYLDINLSDG